MKPPHLSVEDVDLEIKWSIPRKVVDLPTCWTDNLPTSEEIWIGGRDGPGWQCGSGGKEGSSLMRNFQWHRYDNFPRIFADIMKHLDAEDVSIFTGHCESNDGTLGWHIDEYHVWALNIEGTTTWSWFDLVQGKVLSEDISPGSMMIMPMGVTHKVDLVTQERTSISFITRYGVPPIASQMKMGSPIPGRKAVVE